MKKFLTIIAVFAFLTGCTDLANKNTVRFGAIVGLSGNSGSLGEDTRNGIQLAIDEQNAAGGILGKKIVLDVRDSKTEAATGVDIARQMVENENDKPIGIYTQSSVVSVPVKPVAEKNKVIMFAISGAESLVDQSKYVFRNWANPKIAGDMIVNFISDSLKSKNVGIFYCNNDYGKSMNKFISPDLADKKIPLKFASAFDEKDGDYKSLIANYVLSDKSIDCIYTVGLGGGMGTLIKQLRESGFTGNIISDITAPYPNVLNAAGNAAKGMYYLDFAYDNHSSSPTQQEYYNNFKKSFHTEPLNFSVVSYEALKLLFQAIQQADSFDPDKVNVKLNEIKGHNGLFGNVTIAGNEVAYPLNIKRIPL